MSSVFRCSTDGKPKGTVRKVIGGPPLAPHLCSTPGFSGAPVTIGHRGAGGGTRLFGMGLGAETPRLFLPTRGPRIKEICYPCDSGLEIYQSLLMKYIGQPHVFKFYILTLVRAESLLRYRRSLTALGFAELSALTDSSM
jgi:hypothetical protein